VTTPYSTTTTRPRFLLLGDSHAGVIGRAAQAAGIAFAGGPIGSARDFNADFFDRRGHDIVFRDAGADQHYRTFLSEVDGAGLGGLAVPLVCTFGFSPHVVATTENWHPYRQADGGLLPGFLASGLFDDIVTATARGALAFYRLAGELGLRVLAVLAPQQIPVMADPAVFRAAQESLRRSVLAAGAEVVDLRDRVTGADGRQRPEFCDVNDPIHGNLAFGRLILADLLARGL
jgi:hypothetical protein